MFYVLNLTTLWYNNYGLVHDVGEFSAAVRKQSSTVLLDAGHGFQFVVVTSLSALGARIFRLRFVVSVSAGR